MEQHQQRVVDEQKELDIKIKGLQRFIEGGDVFDKLPKAEREDMMKQLNHMRVYTSILTRRINRF